MSFHFPTLVAHWIGSLGSCHLHLSQPVNIYAQDRVTNVAGKALSLLEHIHPSIHPPTHPLIHPSTHPPIIPSTHPPTHLLIHPPTHPHTHTHSYILPPIYPSIFTFTNPPIYPSAHLSWTQWGVKDDVSVSTLIYRDLWHHGDWNLPTQMWHNHNPSSTWKFFSSGGGCSAKSNIYSFQNPSGEELHFCSI